jgi:Asp/Glu/hydantoin racemase
VIGHFQEPGLTEIRGSVNIPVVSLGEATMLFACSLGRKIGLVTINPVFLPWHEEQIRRHGLEHRVIGVAAIEADLSRFMRAFDDPAELAAMRADFVARVAPLIARGAEVIIPAGGLPMLLFAEQQPFVVDGTLVLEGIATVLKATEMAVAIHRATGAVAARSGLYRQASASAIADFVATRGG